MSNQVLIVEDDPGMRVIYRRVLTDLQFEVQEASDGAEAITLLNSTTPTLVFLDMLLPRVNGLAVLDYMNQNERLQNTHVVIVSSNRSFEPEAARMRRVDYVQKPIRPAQIRELALAASQA